MIAAKRPQAVEETVPVSEDTRVQIDLLESREGLKEDLKQANLFSAGSEMLRRIKREHTEGLFQDFLMTASTSELQLMSDTLDNRGNIVPLLCRLTIHGIGSRIA